MRKLGQNLVDRVFDDNLAKAEMPVSDKVWAGIASELEKDGLRRMVFWYRSVAVASVVMLIGLGTWMLLWQTGNTSSGAIARGKSFKNTSLEFAATTCTTENALQWADGQQNHDGSASAKKKSLATAVQWTVRTGPLTKLKQALQVAPPRFSGEHAPAAEAYRAIKKDIENMQQRQPSLLPAVSSRDLRRPITFAQEERGVFAEWIAPKASEKRQSREYAYVIEDEATDAKQPKHWEIGAGVSPDMSFASTTPVERSTTSYKILADNPAEANTNKLSPVMAFASSLRGSYEINDRISVRSGLSFLNRQSSTTQDVNAAGKVATYQSKLSLSSMEIPMSVRYNVIRNPNFEYFVSGGVSGNFLLRYDNSQVATNGDVTARKVSDKSDVLRPSQANLLVSTGMKYRLMDRVNLQVEPGLRYGILTNEYAFSQTRPISLSLMTGINYHF